MEDTLGYMTSYFKQYANISFLDNTWETYEGYTFVGLTLWSAVTNPQYKINEQVKNGSIKIFSDNIDKITNKFLLKIAGIWETDMYYGLTYKFIKL